MVNDVETLYCINPECPAKAIKTFTLFVSRDAMNIDGLSQATLEKFIGHGYLQDFGDIFELDRYREEIIQMDGFGEKSYENLWQSIQRARHTVLWRVIYGLGILNIGLANAKMICREFDYDLDRIRHATVEELTGIDGIGEVIGQSLVSYFADEKNNRKVDHLMTHLELEKPEETGGSQKLSGLTFVITGSLEHFGNRSEMKNQIEALGGKVTGSVTKKTSYLINNDAASTSSKNKKAAELGIPVISEEEFLKKIR